MKYIIEIEDEPYMREDGVNYYTCKSARWYKLSETIINRLIPYTEPDRKAIEDEVWRFAWEVLQLDLPVFREIFGYDTVKMDYRDFKYKYEAWLKQKDETFDTGDEVYNKEIDSKGVILRRYNSDTLDILWDDGSAGETFTIKAITKTGRHFPEVAELLEKMKGEEE